MTNDAAAAPHAASAAEQVLNADLRNAAFYAVDRDTDVSGVSGTGRVAYAIEFPTGVTLVWDGKYRTVDFRDTIEQLRELHGHVGATRVTPLDRPEDEPARQRARELLAAKVSAVVTTFALAVVQLGLGGRTYPAVAGSAQGLAQADAVVRT